MQLIKPKVLMLDGIAYPSSEIQPLTDSIVTCFSPEEFNQTDNESVGIIFPKHHAQRLLAFFPASLPVITDTEWQNVQQLDHFFTQLYLLQRIEILAQQLTHHGIILFHSQHKYLIMAYSPTGYQLTGKLVAGIKKGDDLKLFFAQYKASLMEIFALMPPKNIQVNALSHMQGYFKRRATRDEKKHLLALINDYRDGRIPINQPLLMMRQLLIQYPDSYLSEQYYFEPYPHCEQIRVLPYS
ncbi:YbgA family protein [Providencia alcalifaciens]|uniref:YbgA family protein n=1 Tax=Providencia alcalifaciens TaxID=126385 RepID=UPI001CE03F9F|nr:YbgA family protein [Providencia alcalifaciens]